MKIQIRRATEKDIPSIQALFKEGDDLHSALLPLHFRSKVGSRKAADIKEWIHPKGKLFLIAHFDTNPVGLIHCRQTQFSGNPVVRKVKTLVIETIIVKQAYRRLGIGKKLIREVEKYAKAKIFKRIILNVFEKNTGAIELYKRMDFERISVKMEKEL